MRYTAIERMILTRSWFLTNFAKVAAALRAGRTSGQLYGTLFDPENAHCRCAQGHILEGVGYKLQKISSLGDVDYALKLSKDAPSPLIAYLGEHSQFRSKAHMAVDFMPGVRVRDLLKTTEDIHFASKEEAKEFVSVTIADAVGRVGVLATPSRVGQKIDMIYHRDSLWKRKEMTKEQAILHAEIPISILNDDYRLTLKEIATLIEMSWPKNYGANLVECGYDQYMRVLG